MKKIALDLDGVLFDSENLYRVYTEIYDTDIHKKDNIVDNTQRIFQKRYNWSENEFKEFYDAYAEKVLESANFMTGAPLILSKLMDKFEIIIVTSRNNKEVEIARKKFKDIGINNLTIFNSDHSKIERCIKENVDYIIDDDDSICINAAKNNIKALYLKNNASNKINESNVINVNNWGEIYKYLMLNYGD